MRFDRVASILEGLSKVTEGKGVVTREDFLSMKSGDIIPLDGGENLFTVQKVNDKNIEMSEKLKNQLKSEGLYDNSYVGFIASGDSKSPFSQNWLPIYGNSSVYVTKWFTNSEREAVEQSLRDRNTRVLKRAND